MAPNSNFDHDEHDINQLSSEYAKRCRQLNKENGALDNTLSTAAIDFSCSSFDDDNDDRYDDYDEPSSSSAAYYDGDCAFWNVDQEEQRAALERFEMQKHESTRSCYSHSHSHGSS